VYTLNLPCSEGEVTAENKSSKIVHLTYNVSEIFKISSEKFETNILATQKLDRWDFLP
jgi:hypothetical protein